MRQQEIHAWLSGLFPQQEVCDLKYLQADASHRKYLRMHIEDKTFVIMDTKPDQELINFIKIAKILRAAKINAPEIIHCNAASGLILMSDLGCQTYQTALQNASQQTVDRLYLDAITTLIKIQRINPQLVAQEYQFAHMDDAYIAARLEIFKTWYLHTHLQIADSGEIQNVVQRMQTLFSQVFRESTQVLVHVDYHCRNLMAVSANNPGVLDFQDAMVGPATYDLVSLFQDAYITWPRSQVESFVELYREFAIEAGIIEQISTQALLRNFDLVGLQRHIKNLGIFARLHHRDNKSTYLQDIPMLLQYITQTCSRYGELSWLLDFIAEAVKE